MHALFHVRFMLNQNPRAEYFISSEKTWQEGMHTVEHDQEARPEDQVLVMFPLYLD